MSPRQSSGSLAQSPIEVVAFPLVLGGLIGIAALWGTGVVIGSILGAQLPGSPAHGVASMLGSFPDIGTAWEPAVPSLLIWAISIAEITLLAPLLWKLVRAGRLHETGAQWATRHDLRRAGLLVADRRVAHAIPETGEATDAN